MPTVRRIGVSQLRQRLAEVIRRVNRQKEYIVLEKGGLPVAAILDIDEFEDYLELRDPEVASIIAEGYLEYESDGGRPAGELLKELETEEAGDALSGDPKKPA